MLILALDTATPWGTLAVCNNEEALFEISLKAGKGSGEYLLSSLDKYLHKINLEINDLDLVVVGTGPGSYTGIRVGMATATGIAEGLNIPLYQLNTLRIIAENCRYQSRLIAPVIDARREEVYAALYESGPDGLTVVKSPHSTNVHEFREYCANYAEVVLCGDGSKKYQSVWGKLDNIKIAPAIMDRPSASLAAQIAYAGSIRDNQLKKDRIEPSYLKRVEAEIRWEEKTLGNQGRTNDAGRFGSGIGD